jgi:hypothetical protein
MMPRERGLLCLRFAEIDFELAALAEGRVVDGDPATVERELLMEQEEIEYRLGVEHFEERDGTSAE